MSETDEWKFTEVHGEMWINPRAVSMGNELDKLSDAELHHELVSKHWFVDIGNGLVGLPPKKDDGTYGV